MDYALAGFALLKNSHNTFKTAPEETYGIPFNLPWSAGTEAEYIQDAIKREQLSGNGYFTKLCQDWLISETGGAGAFLTQSGTDALEMAALLADIKPGDEVILPSFTFVTTASSVALRGGVPVFIDIRVDTLNLDEGLIEKAITPKTRAILPVHYGGVACEMDSILSIAEEYGLMVIEDAAHGILSQYKGKPLGSFGSLAAFSFHETKNISCGEGGALIVNDVNLLDRANIIWNKGTNRKQFLDGLVDKYTWQELGSSFLPSEITAAVLWSQIESAAEIQLKRLAIWNGYHNSLEHLETEGFLRRPFIPRDCKQNGHLYFIVLNSRTERDRLLAFLKQRNIDCVFHYVPLHSSPAGEKFGRPSGELKNTDSVSERMLRLPFFNNLSPDMQSRIVGAIEEFFQTI